MMSGLAPILPFGFTFGVFYLGPEFKYNAGYLHDDSTLVDKRLNTGIHSEKINISINCSMASFACGQSFTI